MARSRPGPHLTFGKHQQRLCAFALVCICCCAGVCRWRSVPRGLTLQHNMRAREPRMETLIGVVEKVRLCLTCARVINGTDDGPQDDCIRAASLSSYTVAAWHWGFTCSACPVRPPLPIWLRAAPGLNATTLHSRQSTRWVRVQQGAIMSDDRAGDRRRSNPDRLRIDPESSPNRPCTQGSAIGVQSTTEVRSRSRKWTWHLHGWIRQRMRGRTRFDTGAAGLG